MTAIGSFSIAPRPPIQDAPASNPGRDAPPPSRDGGVAASPMPMPLRDPFPPPTVKPFPLPDPRPVPIPMPKPIPLPPPLPPGCGPKPPGDWPDFPGPGLPPAPPRLPEDPINPPGDDSHCCPDDTKEWSYTPFIGPKQTVLDTGRCGPDKVKIVINENGSATVTVNGNSLSIS